MISFIYLTDEAVEPNLARQPLPTEKSKALEGERKYRKAPCITLQDFHFCFALLLLSVNVQSPRTGQAVAYPSF